MFCAKDVGSSGQTKNVSNIWMDGRMDSMQIQKKTSICANFNGLNQNLETNAADQKIDSQPVPSAGKVTWVRSRAWSKLYSSMWLADNRSRKLQITCSFMSWSCCCNWVNSCWLISGLPLDFVCVAGAATVKQKRTQLRKKTFVRSSYREEE